MLFRLRPFAFVTLIGIGVAYLWMLVDVFHYWGAPLWPNENTVLSNWLIFVVLTLHIPFPLLGFWLMSHAYWRGGGRFAWRWWVGGSIVLIFLWSLWLAAAQFVSSLREPVVNMAAHPWLGTLLALAAILPIWIATAPRTAK